MGLQARAKAVLRLDRHVTPLIEANTFKAVPGIGPTTDRIARELIFDGKSAFVEEAIRAAGKEEAIAKLRAFRQHFISRATMEEVLARRGRRRGGSIAVTFRCTRFGATGRRRSSRS